MRKSILVLIIVSIILSGTSVAFSDSRAVKSRPAVVRKGDSVLLSSGDISKQKSGWKELESKLKARTGDFNGEVGVYIKDLQNGWEISINGEHKIPSASLVKIPIMVSCYKAAANDAISLQQTVKLLAKDKTSGSGELQNEPTGKKFAVQKLIEQMVIKSDNTATNMLIKFLGFDALNISFIGMGLKHTNLSRKMMDFKARANGVENYTTARDMGVILDKLYHDEVLSSWASNKCLDILKRQKYNDRIPARLPKNIDVAHKTGLEKYVCHDAGIVYTRNGDFVICVLIKHPNKTAGKAKRLISDLAYDTYKFYNGNIS